MKQIAGSLRLDLALSARLEAFAPARYRARQGEQSQLDRGYRM